MDQFVEVLKIAAGIASVLLGAVKLFRETTPFKRSFVEERAARVKDFFEEGGVNRHPFLVESSFGAILGHLKLSTDEIAYLLRHRHPTAFITQYLEARPFLQLQGREGPLLPRWQVRTNCRRFLFQGMYFLLYVVFAGPTAWLLLSGAPSFIASSAWAKLAGALILTLFMGAIAAFCIIESRRIGVAYKLVHFPNAT
ncbi:MAG: hypothetical protein IDH49_15185 [Gammaproteobacteria bacterium]|nr:hypothetical protein [Gammaproteobacteria bacterium]